MSQIDLQYTTVTSPVPEFIFEGLREYSQKTNSYHPQPPELKTRLARKFHVLENMIFLTAGADEGIEMFAIAYGSKTYVFTPAYIFYQDIREMHADVTQINSFSNNDFVIDTKQRKDATLFFLANPNNPFGYTQKEKIIELIENNPQAIVVVDEVYAEFVTESVINLLQRYKNLAVLRSFSKSYSLAGNRIGCIIANPEIIKAVQWKTQWANVSYLSVGAAMTALDHEEYFEKIRLDIVSRRKDFEEFLSGQRLQTLPSFINCVTLKFASESEGLRFNKFLKRDNIITNIGNGASMVGVDNSFVRIAIGTDEEMDEVKKIISKYSL